ncbi:MULTISPECIES: MFS transporter [unclassified Pseudomonas]|uniref:MFS transporter n=1 Tax=unclassified Pseudomonas TaxID=196821 RepID=UPI000C86CF47|nr:MULTISPECIES: MFS transporter [unclassified Pseudomonas]PMV26522.1 MFS transporter [Pseudomonas sp. FW305-3-2-15-C-TSA2]PMV31893.1 MFS transporter [Pseudomonas sp. DP16D-L5]PMV41310.1 MFS transporter [Pseudomonas sp. FW305-3-2-15-A-LB2]PMV48061.1 MFS transporter [Pseudomonas sp. FW305-3-2-15-C-R2A1]PMV54518.1 MFS transporter [Pseudomonas sp. FW305-3-2-15-C-LB1]
MTYRSKVAWIFLLGFALDLVNMFVATVAYPDIARELHASVTQLAWISNAYLIGLTVIIPLSVWLAAVMGERTLIAASLLLFAGASVMVGQASSIETLIGWRALQGLGGGLLIPVGQAMAYRHFPAAERSQLTARVMSVALLVPALSPALGGLIVDNVSWRWIFYANLPLALMTLLLTVLWIKPDRPSSRRVPLDVGSIFQQMRSPMLRTAMLIYLCIPGVFIGTSLIAILYLRGLGYDATQTGALMLPWALASALAILLSKKLFNRCGPKPLLLAGMLLQCLGILLLNGPALIIPAYLLMGLGGSLCSSTAQTLAFLDIPAERMGHASALWNINRQVSFCLGAAALSALLSALDSFAITFTMAAALTLLPLFAVLRLDASRLRALLHPASEPDR